MSWKLFASIVDQVPDLARVVLLGVGEPMLVKALPRRIRHLKGRGMCALFNTNAHCCRRRNIGRCSIAGWMNCASCSTWRT
jgi:hypothetical protein